MISDLGKKILSNSTNSISNYGEDVPDFSQSHDNLSRASKENVFHDNLQEDNPIPLPPRDRNKLILTSKARHTRKHPLIIPATSIQRTLEKVKVVTPEEPTCDSNEPQFVNNVKAIPDGKTEPFYVNQGIVNSDTSINTPERDFDTESLHFEAQIDSELAALDEIPSEDLDTQISIPSNIRNSLDLSHLSINKPTRKVFGQINQNVDKRSRSSSGDICSNKSECSEVDNMLHHNVDHVSCEDLLEFADTKPSSRARGNESDEVRIMSKVLGADVSCTLNYLV